jgi:hypothetical protein
MGSLVKKLGEGSELRLEYKRHKHGSGNRSEKEPFDFLFPTLVALRLDQAEHRQSYIDVAASSFWLITAPSSRERRTKDL